MTAFVVIYVLGAVVSWLMMLVVYLRYGHAEGLAAHINEVTELAHRYTKSQVIFATVIFVVLWPVVFIGVVIGKIRNSIRKRR